jgi:transcriptional regulator with XRE-family HTH domain|tara:strand:- start:209 stop:415 length:207 start_codon:yes stop_codon:yes gene_type:complete
MAGIYKQVGKKIRDYRKRKGWSQEKLGFEAGLHRAYVGQIERGEKKIGLVNLEKFSKAFGISISKIIQ